MEWKIVALVLGGLLIGLGVVIGYQYVAYRSLQSNLDNVESALSGVRFELSQLQTSSGYAKYNYENQLVHLGANYSVLNHTVLNFLIAGYRRVTLSISSNSSLNIDITVKMGRLSNLVYGETQWTTFENTTSYQSSEPYRNTFDVLGPQLQLTMNNHANQNVDVIVSTYITA